LAVGLIFFGIIAFFFKTLLIIYESFSPAKGADPVSKTINIIPMDQTSQEISYYDVRTSGEI